jgi:hypothetical protein
VCGAFLLVFWFVWRNDLCWVYILYSNSRGIMQMDRLMMGGQ